MLFFDPLYLLFIAPAVILAAWAQWRVHSAMAAAKLMPSQHGMTGKEAAMVILRHSGVPGADLEQTDGGDHYDPRSRLLRLSPEVYSGRTVYAVAVAAHEAGHALQHAARYPLLVLRNGIVPLAAFGGNISWILMLAGFFLHSFNLIIAGIVAFSLTVLFQLINLPVEFDASARAKRMLTEIGIVTPEEEPMVKRVLSAAAMTYVAGTLTAVMQLLYFLFRAGLIGGSRDDD